MTVTTVYGSTADGRLFSSNVTYATARTGSSIAAVTTGTGDARSVGQIFEFTVYDLYEAFVSFDTSPIADTDVVTQVDLSIAGNTDTSTQDFTIEARISNWGATLTSADWVTGSGLTRVATFPTSSWVTAGAYNNFTEDGTNFRSAVDLTGTTYLVFVSDRMVAATPPSGASTSEIVGFITAESVGTTSDPKLVVTSTAAPTPANKDTATRFRLRVQTYKDVSTRFGLRIQSYKDTLTRFRLSAQNYKDTLTRFRLRVQGYKDTATRFRLSIQGYKDTLTRFVLRAQNYKDVATRFSLIVLGGSYKDALTRFRLSVGNYKDTATRFRLRIGTFRDVASRFSLRVQGYKDVSTRLSLRVQGYRDTATRFSLAILNGAYRDAATRFRLRILGYKDAATRFCLRVSGYRDTGTRFCLDVAAAGSTTRRGWWWWGYSHDEREN